MQKKLIESAAAWLDRTHGDGKETGQVVEAILRTRHSSIRQRIRKMLTSNGLSVLWRDWEALYLKRSRLFHGGWRDGSEHRGRPPGEIRASRLGARGADALWKDCPLHGKERGDRGSRPSWRAFRGRIKGKRPQRCWDCPSPPGTGIAAVFRWRIGLNYRRDNPVDQAVAALPQVNGRPSRHHRALAHAEVPAAVRAIRRTTDAHPTGDAVRELIGLAAVRARRVEGHALGRDRHGRSKVDDPRAEDQGGPRVRCSVQRGGAGRAQAGTRVVRRVAVRVPV